MVASWMHYSYSQSYRTALHALINMITFSKNVNILFPVVKKADNDLYKSLRNWFPKLIQCTVLSIF